MKSTTTPATLEFKITKDVLKTYNEAIALPVGINNIFNSPEARHRHFYHSMEYDNDREKAIQLFRIAAQIGYFPAMLALAKLLLERFEERNDFSAAPFRLQDALSSGIKELWKKKLEDKSEHGNLKDFKEAFDFLTIAAEVYLPEAQLLLAKQLNEYSIDLYERKNPAFYSQRFHYDQSIKDYTSSLKQADSIFHSKGFTTYEGTLNSAEDHLTKLRKEHPTTMWWALSSGALGLVYFYRIHFAIENVHEHIETYITHLCRESEYYRTLTQKDRDIFQENEIDISDELSNVLSSFPLPQTDTEVLPWDLINFYADLKETEHSISLENMFRMSLILARSRDTDEFFEERFADKIKDIVTQFDRRLQLPITRLGFTQFLSQEPEKMGERLAHLAPETKNQVVKEMKSPWLQQLLTVQQSLPIEICSIILAYSFYGFPEKERFDIVFQSVEEFLKRFDKLTLLDNELEHYEKLKTFITEEIVASQNNTLINTCGGYIDGIKKLLSMVSHAARLSSVSPFRTACQQIINDFSPDIKAFLPCDTRLSRIATAIGLFSRNSTSSSSSSSSSSPRMTLSGSH